MLGSLTVDQAVSLSIAATGQFDSDTRASAVTLAGDAAGAALDSAGSITATWGTAVEATAPLATITNAGRISGAVGVALDGADDTLSNSGAISGLDHAVTMGAGAIENLGEITASGGSAVLIDALAGPASLTNTGTIGAANGPAIEIALSGAHAGFSLVNSGMILGGIVSSGTSGDHISGGGRIVGDVSLGAGGDVFSGGHIEGDLDMGPGNDWVDARDGAVSGVIRDAGGSDTYLIDNPATRIIDHGDQTDRVLAWCSTALGRGLENLTLEGNLDLTGDGNQAANRITGNAGANRLDGGMGRDHLDGGAGQDSLTGGQGHDVLTGGAGADVFVFTRLTDNMVSHPDLITDFTAGLDRIDLSGLDAALFDAAGAFTFIGDAGFSGVAGQLRASVHNGMTLVEIDANGDGHADAAIRLSGQIALTASDFLF